MEQLLFGRSPEVFAQAHAATTAKEIAQQPRLWRELVALLKAQEGQITAFMDKMASNKDLRIVFTGAGSSAFIGTALQMTLAQEMGIPSEAVATTDIVSAPDSVLYDVPTLLVSFSRSGESPESMAALQYAAARVKELHNLVLVCKKGSSLANYAASRNGDLTIDMPPESSDEGFAMTSSVSCMALATWCIFGWQRREERFAFIQRLAGDVEAALGGMDEAARKVTTFGYDRLIYLGSGALKGLAQEGAVKSLELTNGGVNASFDSSMGFRHGPKTVVNATTLTAHILSPLPFTCRYDMDFVNEMLREKRGNKLLFIAPAGVQPPEGVDFSYSYPLSGGESADFAEIDAYIKSLVFIQLLSMEKSIERGIPTDNPSVGGEVNRVVQGVTIYPL